MPHSIRRVPSAKSTEGVRLRMPVFSHQTSRTPMRLVRHRRLTERDSAPECTGPNHHVVPAIEKTRLDGRRHPGRSRVWASSAATPKRCWSSPQAAGQSPSPTIRHADGEVVPRLQPSRRVAPYYCTTANAFGKAGECRWHISLRNRIQLAPDVAPSASETTMTTSTTPPTSFTYVGTPICSGA